ncbi:alkyl sulfatase C-terminal domain-containing protein [Streptomyces eurythermus]|uniref:alkyl sulfatase C-terminal domain-containing protein n=1 Tax=Streptomyces eurythermus TaxID=42237 RepID=UPI003402152F
MRWNPAGGEPVTQRLRNGVLTHVRGTSPDAAAPDTEITLTESDLRAVLLGTLTPEELAARDSVTVTGDFGRLTDLLGHLGAPDPDFAIVTP